MYSIESLWYPLKQKGYKSTNIIKNILPPIEHREHLFYYDT